MCRIVLRREGVLAKFGNFGLTFFLVYKSTVLLKKIHRVHAMLRIVLRGEEVLAKFGNFGFLDY